MCKCAYCKRPVAGPSCIANIDCPGLFAIWIYTVVIAMDPGSLRRKSTLIYDVHYVLSLIYLPKARIRPKKLHSLIAQLPTLTAMGNSFWRILGKQSGFIFVSHFWRALYLYVIILYGTSVSSYTIKITRAVISRWTYWSTSNSRCAFLFSSVVVFWSFHGKWNSFVSINAQIYL